MLNLEKQKAYLIRAAFIALILGLVYVGIKYFLPLLMPFVIGLIIAVTFRHLIDFIQKKTKINRVIVSISILLLFYGLLAYLVSLVGFKAFDIIVNLISNLPAFYSETLKPALLTVLNNIMEAFPATKPYVDNFIVDGNQTIYDYLTKASSSIVDTLASFAAQVPTLLIKFIFTIVSSFFFTIDYHKITRFVVIQFTGERRTMLLKLKDNGIGTIGKFIRAYAAIISITFAELSIGFLIIGIPNAVIFAALIALVDIMPILGTGAVLLPWAITALILGNAKIGIGILIIYVVITVVRQTVEPKIVGQQIGLHPIITLILMYIGAQLMGVLGLFILPIMATIIKKLNDEGTIHLFKNRN